jgi:hypothetical protein
VGRAAQFGVRGVASFRKASPQGKRSRREGSMNKALDKVVPVAFAVSALGGVLGEDTAAGFALSAGGAAVLGACVWLLIYRA